MLTISNIRASYNDIEILHDISLKVPKGESLSILGPNGCGKTTFLKTIAHIMPFSGTIQLDGVPLAKMKRKQLAAKIAFMSQTTYAYFPFSVYETVMQGRYHQMKNSLFGSTPSKEDHEIVENCLKTVGLLDLRNKPLDELSGGQLQRVFLAQTLVQEPEIILLDEPTNHLDVKYQLELIAHLKTWAQEKNRTVIGVFHDINLALQLSENVVFMKKGHIVGEGKAEDIMTSEFLKSVYDVDIVSYMTESLQRWQKFRKK